MFKAPNFRVSGVSVQVSGNIGLKPENNENIRPLLLLNSKGSILATEGLTPDT